MKEEQNSSVPLLIRLCSEKAAFEVRMQRRVRFDMDKAKHLFEEAGGYEIFAPNPYIMVFKSPMGAEVTLSSNGRMLIKHVSGENEARAVARDVIQVALKAQKAP